MKKLNTSLALLVAFVYVEAPALSQYVGSWDMGISNMVQTSQLNQMNKAILEETNPGDDVDQDNRVDVSLTYTSSKSRTRANLQSFIDKSRAVDPAGATQLEQLFGSTDIMGQIGDVMASVGLSKNNAADAFAVYWIAAWQASVGEMPTASSVAYKAVAAQAARGLSQSPELTAATDAQKQEMAEALLVQAALIDGHKEAAAGDSAQLKALSKAVKQGASASGLELGKMILTEDGFKPRKGADASGAMDNDIKQASAAGSDKTLQYGLMAALGLGAAFMIGKGMKRG
jgi:hypothetical protein